MKKLIGTKSRLSLGSAIIFSILSIFNSCTKTQDDSIQPPPPSQNSYAVNIFGGFNPGIITVKAGASVTWTNNSGYPSSITSVDGLFDGIIHSYESYSYMFLTAGTYNYFDRMNPSVTGKVIVKE